jgi:Xaa-Pro dipeptidase
MSLVKVRQFLREKGYDGILIRKRNNFSWITGGKHNHIVLSVEEGVADLVIFQDKVYVITTKMEERRILEEEAANLPFEIELLSDDWYNGSDHLIRQVTHSKKMATDTPYLHFEYVDDQLGKIRSVLSEDEIVRYRKLCQLAARAVEETCQEIQPGQTEHEIAAILSQKVMSQGARVQVALVATDERIYKYRHPIPTDKKLEKHAMIVLCAEKGGLVANVTRLVHFGELPDQLKENKQRLARIDVIMNMSTKPGVTVGEVVKVGIAQYAKEGFPEDWKLLHQGGITGFKSREYLATPDSKDIITVNQAFAWNPALPGVKSEDTILLTENGIEFLTHTNEWKYIEVEHEGKIYQRPDILVR